MSNAGLGPAAVLVHQDGTSDAYQASSNTDAAAGTTIMQAASDAVSGKTIFVFRNASITSSLAKDGVNWWIAPGVTLTKTSGATGLFDDGGTAMSY